MPIRLSGVSASLSSLKRIQEKLPNEISRALFAEANIEMTEAKRRTPVWNPANKLPPGHVPGTLRASGMVHPPVWEMGRLTVELTFGGGASEYALYVHEDLDAFHATGQAKFLESTIMESAPHMAARVARRIKLAGLKG